MSINEYKTALMNIIDATDDEELLKHWKAHLELGFEQYRQKQTNQSGNTGEITGRDHNPGFVVLESGLGIDE